MEERGIVVERVRARAAVYLRLSGTIDGAFGVATLGTLDAPAAIDLSGIRAITSHGVRGFMEAITSLGGGHPVYLVDCPPCVVDQLNLVQGFAGGAEVLSARALFSCDCGREEERQVDVLSERGRIRGGQPPEAFCDRCGAAMRLIEDDTFRFAVRDGATKLDPHVRAALLELGVYAAAVLEDRPLTVSKVVDGEHVAFRLEGAIASRIRLERTADDDGIVALLLGALIVRAPGAEPFARLLDVIAARAREVVLVAVPPQLAGLLANGALAIGRAKIDSLLVPVRCDGCADLALATRRLHEPEEPLRCPRCGRSAEAVGAPAHVEALLAAGPPSAEARAFLERVDGLFSQAQIEARLIGRKREPTPHANLPSQIGGYQIVRPLSAGGMAEVLLAKRESMGGVEKVVALKRFRRELFQSAPAAIAMFLAEARLAAQLSHPNVVQIFDVGEADGDLYMAMEYVDGRDLRELVDEGRAAPPHVAAHIGVEVARALAYLHEARDLHGRTLHIVHRDVSPQNILVDKSGRVVLIDFGVALAGEGELQKRRRKIAGNLAYMSPEQCYGEPLDGRSDLFSLGVVLWELLASAPLFRRDDVGETRKALLGAPVPPLTRAPPQLAAFVMRLLERERDARPASAREVALELDAMVPSLGGRVTPAELGAFISQALTPRAIDRPAPARSASPSAAAPTSSRRWTFAMLAGAAALALALIAWLAVR